MFETDAQIQSLQELLDRSYSNRADHTRTIVNDERRLTARQMVQYLQGVKHVTLATVTSKNEPFAAPLDALFVHGEWVMSTAANSLRVAHLRRNPAASLCHLVGDDIAFWAHGTVDLFGRGEGIAPEWERVAIGVYGESPYNWADEIVVMCMNPRVMFAYCPDPAKLGL